MMQMILHIAECIFEKQIDVTEYLVFLPNKIHDFKRIKLVF
jgi:hypothetical protein